MVTAEQHNKYLAWAHLAHAGIFALFTVAFLTMFGIMFIGITRQPANTAGPNGAPPPAFFLVFWLFFALMYSAFIIPSFIAGYALLKRKRWARLASIIAGVVAAMFFPTGTAVCVYTFWFLFSEPGRLLYDKPTNPASLEGNQYNFQPNQSAKLPDWR